MDAGFAEFDLRLRDGRRVHVRAMRPSDETAFLDTFSRLSEEARSLRFMRVVGVPNVERLRQALATFPERGLGLVAIDGEDRIADAR